MIAKIDDQTEITSDQQDEIEEEPEIQADAVPVSGSLSVVGRRIEILPVMYGQKYGKDIHSLDISHNNIRSLENVQLFPKLKSLVADNNQIDDSVDFPPLPSLETLWMNNNRITEIKRLLDQLCQRAPQLSYLSLMKNPACPHRISGNEDEDYARYRLYVLWRIPKLRFLDSSPVTTKEKQEAQRRGEFCLPKTPAQIVSNVQTIDAQIGATADNQDGPSNSTHYGVCKYYYQGKQSEGNRFIRNQNL
ncbi:MAG: putative leucine-rich melanocyte differentiation-associated protein [Streblomastix strix]|uniref:Putative leucine-rich melanocyte differentiation-associated protein n=1 Tax=Streblomastix strix TaxID=222440 RepID=A0A5J4W6E8_9EUKA|nr:MAG: putative leucine-rich melanocyte differentiation-associated protein [Streblomastix strix]